MTEVIHHLAETLFRTETFDQGAATLGRALLETLDEVIEESEFAEHTTLLRVMVHVRPDDGYRKLAVIEHDNDHNLEQAISYVPSATAWRWVVGHQSPVSIDAVIGRVQPHVAGVPAQTQKSPVSFEPLASKESLARLMGRRVTHLCAFPIRMPGSVIAGFVAVEVEAQRAIGKDLIWILAGKQLQILVDVAAPYLVNLPLSQQSAISIDDFLPVVGRMTAPLVSMLRIFARQNETILLSGPTGAGKSRLARWCKEQSERKNAPFEVLDLMTVPEDLQMAELFGWKRGAFTGAVKDSEGSVGRAEGGTLFIDEIDKLSLKAQAGLLHLLEERTYRALGEGGKQSRANVRFIVGTNANLLDNVEAGKFREDLYYRINVLPLKIPALDERADEIAAWADFMLQRRHKESTTVHPRALLTEAARHMLAARRWPGNLRQLDNVVRRAYALSLMKELNADGEIRLTDVEIEMALAYEDPRGRLSVADAMSEAARRYVIQAELHRNEKCLALDHSDAFKGLVLAIAEERLGNKEAVFRLLGKEALVVNRNHHKPFRKEIEKVQALYEALGEGARFPFARLLES